MTFWEKILYSMDLLKFCLQQSNATLCGKRKLKETEALTNCFNLSLIAVVEMPSAHIHFFALQVFGRMFSLSLD